MLEPHHVAWLGAHLHRTEEWLSERLKDGFDIHHLDGDHSNNDPANLVLIEASDHMMLHGGRQMRRIGAVTSKGWTHNARKRMQKAYAKEKARMDAFFQAAIQ